MNKISQLQIKPALRRFYSVLSTACYLVFISACSSEINTEKIELSEQVNAGGEATVSFQPFARFDLPAPTLDDQQKTYFYAGRALAHQPWVKAPTSTTARDGLGPLFNARSCLGCHIKGGRGTMPVNEDSVLFSALVRLSLPGSNTRQGVIPDPIYGDQLQTQSVGLSAQLGLPVQEGELAPEADLRIRWHYDEIILGDGSSIERRRPEIIMNALSHGPLNPSVRTSLRNAPGMFGMGLIESIPQDSIDELADPDDVNGDGISGRRNLVWNPITQSTEAGLFGLKANRPNLKTIVASAFAGDIGITNPLFPNQPCSSLQKLCLQQADGNDENGFELPADLLDLTVNFVRDIAVPEARLSDHNLEGRNAFYLAGCHSCHQPSYTTINNDPNLTHLNQQKIWPYSDFLLHDMGEELADNRSDFEASGREWRTPPLWGIGLQKKNAGQLSLLHDGRARTIEEAILWHGGEAQNAKEKYMLMTQSLRHELDTFVEAL